MSKEVDNKTGRHCMLTYANKHQTEAKNHSSPNYKWSPKTASLKKKNYAFTIVIAK